MPVLTCVDECACNVPNGGICAIREASFSEDVPLVELMYLVFTGIPVFGVVFV